MRGRIPAGLLALVSTGVLALACNALLGNDDRTLVEDAGRGGSRTDRGSTGTSGGPSDAPVEPLKDSGPCAPSTDLASDPAHCGSCGHDCLGGACAAGKCQPFTIAKGLVQPKLMTIEGDSAFWIDEAGDVATCRLPACDAPTRLMGIGTEKVPTGLVVTQGRIYVLGYYTHEIATCPIEGCATPAKIATNLDYPEDLRTDGTNLYFLSANGGWVGRCVLPMCAGGPARIATRVDTTEVFHNLAVNDANAFWIAGPNNQFTNAIAYRAAKSATDAGPVEIGRIANPRDTFARPGFLFANEAGRNVFSIAVAPGNFRSSLSTTEVNAYDLAVDETHAYWFGSGTGAIRRCALAGCNGIPETIVDGQNQPRSILATDRAIYWTEFGAGTIRGLAK